MPVLYFVNKLSRNGATAALLAWRSDLARVAAWHGSALFSTRGDRKALRYIREGQLFVQLLTGRRGPLHILM